MKRSDVREIVAIHRAAFAKFFLSFLGYPFLSVFYQSTLVDQTSIALVSEQDNRIIGFVVGAVEPHGFYKRIFARYWWRFALALVPTLSRHPFLIIRIIRRLVAIGESAFVPGEALLMSIAVDPRVQSKGTGGALVTRFLCEAKERGASAVSLTTDELDNESVNRFYQYMGFVCRRTFLAPEGRRMNEYRRQI